MFGERQEKIGRATKTWPAGLGFPQFLEKAHVLVHDCIDRVRIALHDGLQSALVNRDHPRGLMGTSQGHPTNKLEVGEREIA